MEPTVSGGASDGRGLPRTEDPNWRVGKGGGPFGAGERLFKKVRGLRTTCEKRRFLDRHYQELGSVKKACQIAGLARSSYYYQSHKREGQAEFDVWLEGRLKALAAAYPRYGYRQMTALLRRERVVNHKRVRRMM